MTANTQPIFTLTPHVSWGAITTANTAMDGTGTVTTIFTAGTNGSYISKIIIKFQGSSTATVVRFFVNNGSTNATAANNSLIAEQQLPNVTASNSTAQPTISVPIDIAIPNGYVLTATIGTTVTNAISINAIGGDY